MLTYVSFLPVLRKSSVIVRKKMRLKVFLIIMVLDFSQPKRFIGRPSIRTEKDLEVEG